MGDASIRPGLKLTITATTPNKTAEAPAPVIATGDTHKIINAAKSPACPVFSVDQKIAAHKPLAKPMFLRPASTPADGLEELLSERTYRPRTFCLR